MIPADVVLALAALAHEHRLAVFRLLVAQGGGGLPAGTIADHVGLVPSSLTFHLQALLRAGLVTQVRRSRQLIYSADIAAMNDLLGFLTDKCCAASASSCAVECKPGRTSRQARRPKAA